MASSTSNSNTHTTHTTIPNPPLQTSSLQAPLLLLSNMSNLMSVKLDSTNFIVWKHQLSTILRAYSMIDFVDGTIQSPSQFLIDVEGNFTIVVNPEFQSRNTRDQALLTLINSTLSPSVLPMVVGQNSAQSVWKTLEHRFTSTSRANVLNLKIELHNLKKELLYIILKGLPREFGPFCSAIRTRNEPVNFEEIMVLLQTKEQSITENCDSGKDFSSMAMFASAAPPSRNTSSQSSFYVNNSQNRGRGRNNGQRGRGGRHPLAKLAAMASTSNASQAGETWLTDTGAIDHLTANLSDLSVQAPYKGNDQVAVGNGQSIPINNIGAVHKLCKHNNCSCYFDSNKFLIQDLPSGKVLYKGLSENGLYPIHTLPSSFVSSIPQLSAPASTSIQAFLSSKNKWQLWHQRLDHPSDRVLVSALPSLSPCISANNKHVQHHCQHCLIGKMHKLPFVSSQFQSTQPLELVHSDVWGPAPVNSCNGYRYYLLFVDDYSRFSWLYLLKHKSDVLSTFKHFQATVENLLSKKIKILRTDCGGEYTSNAFTAHCASHGITHHLSCPHTPQQNGIVERKHRHIVECALTLLSHAALSITHYSYAITTTVHLINRLPTPKLTHKTPWELLFHKPPDLTHLKTFGCLCFPLLRPYNTHKLQPRSTPCIFLGYPSHSKGYICLDPTNHRIYISRHVLFNETEFLSHLSSHSRPTPSPVTSTFDPIPWLSVFSHTCTPHLNSAPLTSISAIPTSLDPISSSLHAEFGSNTTFPIAPSSNPTPPIESTSYPPPSLESILPPSSPIASLQSSDQSTIPPAPINTHPMHTRSKNGIYKPKTFHTATLDYTQTEPPTYHTASKFPQWNSDGSISQYKARLMAKGFHQQHGIDFEETILEVRNAFLHGVLKEKVYMTQPLGYINPHFPKHVCRLHKSIYGLKQAPCAWFESFTTQLLNLGFHSSTADSSLFIYKAGSTIAFLLLYVDDIVLTGNNPQFISQLIVNLSKVFELKDMGTLSYFLGLQIQRSITSLSLTQTKYATNLLTKHNMLNCSPCKIPCVPHVRLSNTTGTPLTDVHAYRSLVGALHYLTFTLPDLSFAVHQVCQFMNAPTDIHLVAAKRILRYLRGTLDHGLYDTPGPTSLSAFTDADWAGDPNDRCSTSGLLVFLGHSPITWSMKKQLTVSRSSTEAEYRALASASAELCWLHVLLKDLGIYFHDLPYCGVTMYQPLLLHPTQSSMLVRNTLKLIFTSFVNEYFAKICKLNLSLQLISLLIFP
uniref:Integrase catalytic domain-containing protein n=1 Tax=Fagus sylvatica TaxID=28930 RepID=A0A2N9GG32_FAGSY